jgi:hypothetical protein
MRLFWSALILLCLGSANAQVPSTLQRTVMGSTLRSPHTPAATIHLHPSFTYVGGDRFDLYGVADAEIHVFVNADEKRNVRRMIWIQFEGFLPKSSETYNYKTKKTAKLGNLEFMVDTRPFGTPDDRESDGGHVKTLLEKNGLHWPENGVRARLIHLPNPDRRSELMIIYVEDGKYAQVPAADLVNFANNQRWPQIDAQLIEHAQKMIRVEK